MAGRTLVRPAFFCAAGVLTWRVRTMNVALVILHADAARGGAERYTVDLAHALADRGHRVSMLATSFAGLDERVHRVRLGGRAGTRLGKYLRFLDALDAQLAQSPYDVVHA